jgi:hypothetical protein
MPAPIRDSLSFWPASTCCHFASFRRIRELAHAAADERQRLIDRLVEVPRREGVLQVGCLAHTTRTIYESAGDD